MSKKQKETLNNYTVEQILSMGDNELNKMNQRQMSHMLRTVSLAANKRITRLEKNAEKGGIATDALNAVQESGGRFYVGNKNRNQMLSELARAREFMNMKTSTVKGSTDVRKNRERMIYGKTREEIAKEQKNNKKKQTKPEEKPIDYDQQLKDVFKAYRKFNEQNPNEARKDYFDSGKALAYIGQMRTEHPELTVDELEQKADQYYRENQYEQKQQEIQNKLRGGTTFSNN